MGASEANYRQLGEMITGYWLSQAIYVAAELGIADRINGQPVTVEELASSTSADAQSLYRVLRALASAGIFAEDQAGRFSLTPLAECLRSDGSASQRALAIMNGAEFYQSWGNLCSAVRTGEPAFDRTFGVPWIRYFASQPVRGEIFDAAMGGFGAAEVEPTLEAYDFSQFGTVADIGGGNGALLAAVLGRYSGASGLLFDLPDVVARAEPTFADLGFADRCQFVGGSFFDSVPAGADAYVLRHILHDWQDDEAVAILRSCRNAMPSWGRVLVIENVIAPGNDPSLGKWLDLMMLVVGGRERTEAEFRQLFSDAGLEVTRVIPTRHEVSVIEGVPAR